MGRIDFTQYLMPDGRKTLIHIDVPDDVYEKAQKILAANLVFEIEMLSDYRTISMTIADKKEEVDVAHKLCPNGPEVLKKVNEMILEFDLDDYILTRGDGQ
jgi:hypothetical protein